MVDWAGIGSQKTPRPVLIVMSRIGAEMARKGHHLRSGGAPGADLAFEQGSPDATIVRPEETARHPAWLNHAKQYHPAWRMCKPFARAAHGRNSAIILGPGLDSPVDSVCCWTPSGQGGGGTGQGIRVARAYDIPVFDLGGDIMEVNSRGIRPDILWDFCERYHLDIGRITSELGRS